MHNSSAQDMQHAILNSPFDIYTVSVLMISSIKKTHKKLKQFGLIPHRDRNKTNKTKPEMEYCMKQDKRKLSLIKICWVDKRN